MSLTGFAFISLAFKGFIPFTKSDERSVLELGNNIHSSLFFIGKAWTNNNLTVKQTLHLCC